MISVKQQILGKIRDGIDDEELRLVDSTPLIGDASVLSSMKLVELCLALEDLAEEMGFEFDWTSESAMSSSRSMFRTAGSLSEEFVLQMDNSN
jgi:hypothetical protein